MKKILDYFIYSNLFIAACALLMAIQTFNFLLDTPPDLHLLAFIFSSTICSYSFHWYLTAASVHPSERVNWLFRNRVIHLVLFCIGLAGAVYFFFYLLPHWRWLAAGAIVTFLYSAPKIPHPWFRALRKVALGKTIFLAWVWMYVTTVLPIVVSGQDWTTGFSLFVCSRFFLIYAICILFDYRDRDDDKAAGIRSLITYFNDRGILVIFTVSLAVFAATTIALYWYGYAMTDIILLLIPGIITAALYNYSRRNFSDMFYYFILDGLMAMSAVLMLAMGR